MARFIINTKAPKGVSSLLTLYKGKNKTLCNYNKCYWELYSEIDECSKELTIISYKLRLPPGEKLWENLMLSPSTDL